MSACSKFYDAACVAGKAAFAPLAAVALGLGGAFHVASGQDRLTKRGIDWDGRPADFADLSDGEVNSVIALGMLSGIAATVATGGSSFLIPLAACASGVLAPLQVHSALVAGKYDKKNEKPSVPGLVHT